MKELDYVFIGWCKQNPSDKVWGVIKLSDTKRYKAKYLFFWGRRGTKYQTKIKECYLEEVNRKSLEKIEGGYKSIKLNELNSVYPEFEKDLQTTTFWTMVTKGSEMGIDSFDKLSGKSE